MQKDEVIHIPEEEDNQAHNQETDRAPGMGETEILPGGITEGDAVPEMPPGSDMAEGCNSEEPGGGLDAGDMAEPTTMADTTGDRATGLTGMRGG